MDGHRTPFKLTCPLAISLLLELMVEKKVNLAQSGFSVSDIVCVIHLKISKEYQTS